eukprot:snap_masked-scaffold_56-processed-gene-1.1-mRNA-1 protein AED:1.00 eAED:1.00 QI:0/0/0/0/1/1/2/0/198
MHKNLPGRFNTYTEKEKILSLFSQEVEITSDADEIKIPYFRRAGDLKHLRLMKEEYPNSDDCKLFLSQFESKILSSSEPLTKAVEGSEVILNDLYKSLLKLPSYWSDLSALYSKAITFCQQIKELQDTPRSYTYRQDSISISLVLIDNKIQLTSVNLVSGDKVSLVYNGGNYYTILGCEGIIYLTPPDARLFIKKFSI